MKNFIYPLLIILFGSLIIGCKTDAQDSGDIKLETQKDSISYFIGSDISRSLIDIKDDIDLDLIIRGLKDGFEGKEALLTQNDMMATMQDFSSKMMAKREEKKKQAAIDNKAAGLKFLEENKSNDGVIVTASGLQYQILTEGSGPKPNSQSKVSVHYRGTLVDGTEFDSSYKTGQPISFSVTGVIPGWTEGLQLMNTGSKYKLFIPSELAYGENGSGPIGPSEVLIFEVELVSIDQ